MGRTSLTGYEVRRRLRSRYLRWRTEQHRETVIQYLEELAPVLEELGWRCVRTYRPEIARVGQPLLRIHGEGVVTTLNVLAVPKGGWGFHEAAKGRGGFLFPCGGDIAHAAQVVDRFLRAREEDVRWGVPRPREGS
ncbi:hypothetical protein [Actinomadura litoris]|uniref:hypothetical protein n=1 Tax=Actinomadura litoris TaxID=2678616 RepID=UPI001FA72EA8|nr:hypothetical protein [Actinomadura litoris]